MSSLQYHLTLKSGNSKTGPIPVTTTSANSCPPACPLKRENGGGCFGDGGPIRLHWDKVSSGERGITIAALASKISQLPTGQLWRHDQVGDLPGIGSRINSGHLRAIVVANQGKRGFTYTHKPVIESKLPGFKVSAALALKNRLAIRAANMGGFTVNLSANTLAHADQLAALDIGPVAVVLPTRAAEEAKTPAGRKIRTPAGRRVVVCPATYLEDVTCQSCELCQKQGSRPIIGFPAHGPSKRKANSIAEGV